MNQLSAGILNKIINGEVNKTNNPMVLQYLGSKLINNGKYRLWLSDGHTMTSYSIIMHDDFHSVTNGNLTEFSVCRVIDYSITKSKSALMPSVSVIYIKSLEIVTSGEKIGHVLGNPVIIPPKINEVEQGEVQVQPVQEGPTERTEQERTESSQHSMTQNNILTVPIESLSPYYGKWTIRARVSAKTDIRHYNNIRGEGKLFSIDLIDESAEIRCTGFNEQVDKFYNIFEKGSIYYITRCQVKPANRQYTTIRHDFELTLTADTAILRYEGDLLQIPIIQFDFIPINEIQIRDEGSVIDVLAVVKSIGDVKNIKSRKSGLDLVKKDILLVDESNTMVTLALWGSNIEKYNEIIHQNSVIAVKTVKISEYSGGKSINSSSSTIIQGNPAIPAAERLLAWFNETDRAKTAKSISTFSISSSSNFSWLSFKEAKTLNVGIPEAETVFVNKAYIGTIKSENAIYKSCPTEGCRKKLMPPVNGMYRCVKCDHDFPNFTYRLIMQATLLDYTEELSVTIFEDEAEIILQNKANTIGSISDPLLYEQVFDSCKFNCYLFKIRMRQETFNNKTSLKAVVLKVLPVNHIDYCSLLIKEIKNSLNK